MSVTLLLLLGCDSPLDQPSRATPTSPRALEATQGAPDALAPAEGSPMGRAVLLYLEGTPDEQIYPMSGEFLTIGGGRENDIQIKNDPRISRVHCKLSRRGATFHIEDAKSSHGTLVNGELITQRQLVGGEEIVVGDTFFRFRLLK